MMIPNTKITGGSIDAILVYLSVLGLLLAIATAIRLKVPFLKKYHVPASLIAGFMGLALGPHFLQVIPASMTAAWGALAGRLIAVIFAPLMMMGSMNFNKSMMKKAVGWTSYGFGTCFIQYAIPMILCLVLFIPMFNINPLFGCIVEEGWIGGHGTAGGMTAVFEELHWTDGASLAVTSATVGLVFGIVSGMVLINLAVKNGWTSYLKSKATLKADSDAEMYEDPAQRPVDTRASVNNGVVDNLAFHVAIILICVFLGWVARVALKQYLGITMAWFVTAMFAGFLLKILVLNHTSWKNCLDRGTVTRIQGLALEFLVVGSVSSINVPVVMAYAVPLIIQQSIMAVVTVLLTVKYCRHLSDSNWFENNMLYYGINTGVFATGMLLLKTCDPGLKSDTLELYAITGTLSGWATGGGLISGMMPYWVNQYGIVTMTGITTVLAIVCLVLPRVLGCWFSVKDQAVAAVKA